MNLDDKIRKIIDDRTQELALLFQDVDAVQEDVKLAKAVAQQLQPLLGDIKTEVKSLENVVKSKPEKPEEEEDEEDEEEEPDTSPTKPSEEVQDMLDDVDKLPTLRRRLLDGLKRGPRLPMSKAPDTSGNNLPDIPNFMRNLPLFTLLEVIQKGYKTYKKLEDLGDDQKNLYNQYHNGTINLQQYFSQGMKSVGDTIIDLMNELSEDELDELNSALEDATDEILDRMFQLGENMGHCCTTMNGKLDSVDALVGQVKRGVDALEPDRQAGQELAILQKTNAVLATVNEIRGRL